MYAHMRGSTRQTRPDHHKPPKPNVPSVKVLHLFRDPHSTAAIGRRPRPGAYVEYIGIESNIICIYYGANFKVRRPVHRDPPI